MIMVHGRKDFSFHHAGLCGNIVRDGLDQSLLATNI